MAKEKFKNKYRIGSARLKDYDYSSNGAYYLTIVTQDREHFFGNILHGKMQLSEIGKIAQKYWDEIPQHFSFIKLDEMVVMPNHIHGILWIDKLDNGVKMNVVVNDMVHNDMVECDDTTNDTLGGAMVDALGDTMDDVAGVETLHATSLQQQQQQQHQSKSKQNKKMTKISPKRGSLSTVIRSFKSIVTKNSRKINPNFKWQPRFYDLIIRNNNELNRIRNYIVNNPKIWERDRNNM